jgi:membrane protein required for colicin V production
VNYIDILIGIPLLYGIYKGFSRGLLIEIATLAGLVLGVYVAVKFSGITEDFLREQLKMQASYMAYVAFGVTVLGVVIGLHLLGRLLTKLVDVICLGLFNKILGALLGAVKYFILVCVLLLLLDAVDEKIPFLPKDDREASLFFNPFLTFAKQIYGWIRF